MTLEQLRYELTQALDDYSQSAADIYDRTQDEIITQVYEDTIRVLSIYNCFITQYIEEMGEEK